MPEKNFVQLPTTITKVVVYLDGARIFRTGKVELKKGFQQVRIEGLSKKLFKDSVRVSGKGKGTLGAIDVETVYQEEISHEELNNLVLEDNKLKKELTALQEQLQFAKQQNEQLKVLSQKFATEFPQWFAAGESKLTTLSEFIDFEGKMHSENLKSRQKLDDEIEKLNKKISIVQVKINEYHSKSNVEQTMALIISIDAAQAGLFEVDFSYQVSGVSWTPSYDVDLRPDKAILKGIAQVRNLTLENWVDVELGISTAVFKPISIIEPNPFYIDVYHPYPAPPPMSYASAAPAAPIMRKAKAMVADEREEMAKEAPKALEVLEAKMVESPAGVQSFEISGKWTIPSDGNNHPITLQTYELKNTKEFYWNANEALGVIAQDKIINGETVILAGKAKVYSESEFIGETVLKRVAPKEEFKLGAREEMRIKAEKKLKSRIKEKAGLAKGKRSISYEYEIIIKNFRKEESFLTIKDIIPYSKSERIKVKELSASNEPTKSELGIYTWEIRVKPSETFTLTYTYDVEWEKDVEISPQLP